MAKRVLVKKQHRDKTPAQIDAIFKDYMERIKKAPNFVKKRGVLNNAESNRHMTEAMLKELHEETYKASPLYSRATEENSKQK